MSDEATHDRQTFETQGSAFLRQNLAEKPEFDYAENRPPRSHALDGRKFTLVLRDKPEERRPHAFGREQVDVEIDRGLEPPLRFVASYEAFELAPGIFFVSYLADAVHSVAMALDMGTGVATVVQGEMTNQGIISTVEAASLEEVAAAQGRQPAFHPPFNLGGTRFLNTYAHNVAYEHIYLTGVYETWLGVKGPQAGQADTEEYHAFKIAGGVYLLYWNEGILTAQMTFLFNFLAGHCVAELFARVEGDIVHNSIGANTTLIHTTLPELPGVTHLDMYSGD